MTRFRDISVARGDDVIVGGAELEFAPGKLSLIMGRSGEGKTSLLMALAGAAADVGLSVEGEFVGDDGENRSIKDLERPVCCLVPQSPSLYDDLTVGENLEIVRTASSGETGLDEAMMARLLDGISLDDNTNSLSGGQRQRVAIIRSLQSGSRICLMDEPNAGLDVTTSTALLELVEALCEAGFHVALAVHHPEPFLQAADALHLLRDGSLTTLPATQASIDEACRESARDAEATDRTGRAEVRSRGHAHWISRFFLKDLWSHALSPTNLLYIGASCSLIAFTLGFITVTRYPFSPLLFDVTVERIAAELGDLFYRFTVPLFVGILIAARSTSLATTDLLQKQLSGSILALRQLNVPVWRYQGVSLTLSMAISGFVLYLFGLIVSLHMLVLAITVSSGLPEPIVRSFVSSDFFSANLVPSSMGWVGAKVMLSGMCVAAVSLIFGHRAIRSGNEIRNTGAAAVLWAVLAVIVVQTSLILLELGL